jgi:hypothetical protein
MAYMDEVPFRPRLNQPMGAFRGGFASDFHGPAEIAAPASRRLPALSGDLQRLF